MDVIILLLIAIIPLALAFWLIAAIVRCRYGIAELTRRVDDLQTQLDQWRASSAAPEPAPEPATAESETLAPEPQTEMPEAVAPPPVVIPPPVIPPMPSAAVPEKIAAVPPVLAREPMTASAQISPPPPLPEKSSSFSSSSSAVPPPPPTMPVPPPEKGSFEMRLGTYWLVRIGVVMLLAGFAFFANYAYHHIVGKLGAGGKIALLYLAGGLLLGAGAWWQRRGVKASLKNYAQVLFAGGLAAVYFTTFAAHHVPALRIIRSPWLDGVLLLLWAGVIAWLADRRKSEVMALFAVGLAFFTSVITRVGEFTLWSNLILTVAAVVFLVRNRWAALSFAGLAASYAGYAFWRFWAAEGWRWAQPGEQLWLGASFLLAYWLVFTAATFLSRSEKLSGHARATFLTLNNGAFFALFLLTMAQVHSGGFWKFSLGYGAALLALAFVARQFLPAEPAAKNTYLTQGLLLVTLGLIFKFTGTQLALVLGVESVALFVLGTLRRSGVTKFFACAAALLATGWSVAFTKDFDTAGLWTAIALGAFLVFNAFWSHRADAEKNPQSNPQSLRAGPTFFTLLALINWFVATWHNTGEESLSLALAGEAAALTFSIYLLRVREIPLLSQSFLALAHGFWLWHFATITPPWWNPALLIAVTLGLSHWWQHQKTMPLPKAAFLTYSSLFALAVIGVLIAWLNPQVDAPLWLVFASGLALGVTLYGLVTRVWPLAIGGQIFLALGGFEFLRQLFMDEPAWYFPLAPLAVLLLFSLGTVFWFQRRAENHPARQPLLQVALVYRWIALLFSLLWLWQYAPDRWHAGTFMLVAVLVFAFARWQQNREALLAAAVYAVASLAALWCREDLAMDIFWPNLLALLALPAMQQCLRRAPKTLAVAETVHGTIIGLAGVSLWRFVSCWTESFTSGFYLTMSWAGLAVLIFAAGMALRERFHRWLGLGILAAALGRVVLVDVWKQETIYRVLTFMVLGVALLVIGFLYNKFQDTLRKWL